MQDKIFYSVCFGFVGGILLSSFLFLSTNTALFISLISFVLILFFSLVSHSKWGIIVCVLLFSFCFGVIRYNFVPTEASEIFTNSLDQKVLMKGLIVDEPDIRETNQKLNVLVSVSGESTNILVTTDFVYTYKYGDEIEVVGKLEAPENFTTDQGKDFDYVNYLRKDGIFFLMSYPDINILSRGNGNILKRFLFSIKDAFTDNISFSIKSPESLLMGGLILGEKSSFNKELRQDFVDTGTIHIVALSGYNVTIVADWIRKLFSFFPRNVGIGAGIFSIILFVIMTGGSSTAVRAGVMACLALFARMINRNYDVTRALIFAGVLMILINPLVLVFDVSFQLSFIATVAVIYLTPKVEPYFLWVTDKFALREIISVTSAAYIFVLPFIVYKMGNLSLVALLANVLILPFIQPTMILGFFTGFLGTIWYGLSIPFGYVAYFLLHYELWIVNLLARIPFASLTIPNFPLILVLVIYAFFIYKLFGRSIKKFFYWENSTEINS